MKKVFVSPLQEILDVHVLQVQEYLEDALQILFSSYLESSSGVIIGLTPTNSTSEITIAAGSLLMSDGLFAELEAPTGVVVSPTTSGTRVDMLVAEYEEVLDSYSSGYVLLDVVSRTEQIQSLPSRKFGKIKFTLLSSTDFLNRPLNKIPICEVTVGTSGITSLIDYREMSLINRFKKELELGFSGFFYGSMY